MKLAKSFQHALSGIIESIHTEKSLKIEIAFGIITIILGFYLNISTLDWMILSLIISSILAAELLNTAIESVVNLASPEFHPLAKKAKDAAAGAVLVLSIGSLVIAWFIFGTKIQHLLFGL